MPILGIMASSITASKLSVDAYESIATATVGSGGAGSISFTSIPSTFKHLQIRGIARDNRSAAANMMKTWVNNDTGANYTDHWLYGDGSTADVFAETTGANHTQIVRISSASTSSNIFGSFVVDILDYANTSKYKTFKVLSGFDGNGSGLIFFTSGLWLSTSAINRIDFAVGAAGGSLFSEHSSFALYGIK
jgi:hypothetical protein